ncbi:carboxypeptidase-like regulatory domain-containing protein [Hyalangium gracile]|uniref:carboxypeptidase-like regulatory domain-containing protein n=1 Tax=Hyalangium gracile TaxID=394092 RepID=UPI001CCB2E90|nr:carboxypeptidase regulatory-like domain-containing protein [Hyalangium gracile]
MKKLVMALVSAMVIGCGDPEDANGDGIADGVQEPNNVSVVVPATPKGTISGQVLTTQQKPLPGAAVTLTIGSAAPKTVTADDSGNFAFTDVPAGAQVLLTFAKEGFASLRASSIIPNSAGNVPINNGNASFGPVLLSELNGQVKVLLVGPTGRPAEGARATLEVDPAGVVLFGLSEETSSKVVVEAVADAQGVLTFDRVPTPIEAQRLNGEYRLSVSPLDANGDGVFETGGLYTYYDAQTLLTGGTVKTESLPYGYATAGALSVTHSNVGSLKGTTSPIPSFAHPLFNMVRPGENIYIVFNQAVQANSVIVGLTDEYGSVSQGVTKTLSQGNTVLTLTPTQGIQVGKEYNLYIRAVALNGSANGGGSYSKTVPFFGGDAASPPNISIESIRFQDRPPSSPANVNGRLDPGETVYVVFNQAMGRYGSESAHVLFDADINSSGVVGDVGGEVGNKDGTGFLLTASEPLAPIQTKTPADKPVFTIYSSGYTTRYSFTYTGTQPLSPASAQISLKVTFANITEPATSGYASIWGVPQTVELTGNILPTSNIPPPAP